MRIYLDNCCFNRPYDDQRQLSVSVILRERFDYTKWQREHFDNADPDEFLEAAYAYDDAHPIKR